MLIGSSGINRDSTGDSGLLSGETDHPPEPAPIPDSGKRALRRLVSRTVPHDELSSLIETIVLNVKAADIVGCLPKSDAQTFIDVTDEACHQAIPSLRNLFIDPFDFGQALNTLNFAPRIRRKCVKSLYKMCAGHTLLPRSLHFELPENQADAETRRGGFADVLKCEYRGRDVAVKALRVYDNNRWQDISNVSHYGAPIPLDALVN